MLFCLRLDRLAYLITGYFQASSQRMGQGTSRRQR
jgi:hypothetical protein